MVNKHLENKLLTEKEVKKYLNFDEIQEGLPNCSLINDFLDN